MKYINREDIDVDDYIEILSKENHHAHTIIKDEHGTLRWEEVPIIRQLADIIGLNDLVVKLYDAGHDKNSELFREIYRGLGYSLSGYWEVFYWEVNNEIASDYRKDH